MRIGKGVEKLTQSEGRYLLLQKGKDLSAFVFFKSAPAWSTEESRTALMLRNFASMNYYTLNKLYNSSQ